MALITCKDCNKEFSTDARRCPHCGAKPPRKIGIVSSLVLIAAVAWGIDAINENSSERLSGAASVQSPLQKEISNVGLEYSWGKDGFGTVMVANFAITNRNSFAVHDLEITCKHYAPSGTLIDSNTRVIYEMVEPGHTKHMKGFNMGFIHSQAVRSACEITDLKTPGT